MLRHGDSDFALAFADVSTGELGVLPVAATALADELARHRSGRAAVCRSDARGAARIAPRAGRGDGGAAGGDVRFRRRRRDASARCLRSKSSIPRRFRASSGRRWGRCSAIFGSRRRASRWRCGRHRASRLQAHMAIDAATRSSLELLQTQRGTVRGSLLAEIDCCVTAGGLATAGAAARRAALRSRSPSTTGSMRSSAAGGRGHAVEPAAPGAEGRPRPHPRADAACARPRRPARSRRHRAGGRRRRTNWPKCWRGSRRRRPISPRVGDDSGDRADATGGRACRALEDEPPLLARDGGFVRRHYDEALDAERALASETRAVVAALQARLIAETDVRSLKIRHNGVLGYFVEVPAGHGGKLLEEPFRQMFIHRQTMANAMRFTTAELAELEGRIARAHEKALEIETRDLCPPRRRDPGGDRRAAPARRCARRTRCHRRGSRISPTTRNFCRPQIDASLDFAIVGGRHPVVESTVKAEGQPFVANDTDAVGRRAVAGDRPQHGRQIDLPAPERADRHPRADGQLRARRARPASASSTGCSRASGRRDDIAHGRSTFMVEMVETAAILNRATAALAGHSRRDRPRHGDLRRALDRLGRGRGAARRHRLPGAVRDAFPRNDGAGQDAEARQERHHGGARMGGRGGVPARSACPAPPTAPTASRWRGWPGCPRPCCARARQVLGVLEQRSSGSAAPMLDDLPLFAAAPAPKKPEINPLDAMLDQIRPDELSPREALELVYELKKARDAGRRS